MARRRGAYWGRKGGYRKSYRKIGMAKKRYGKRKLNGKKGVKSLQKLVREEARKVVMREERQRFTLTSFPGEITFWSSSPRLDYAYFRIPVTQAIPVQRSSGAEPNESWRRRNKVCVKGVSVRMKISYATSVQLMGVCYPARVQAEHVPMMAASDDRPPSCFLLGRKDGSAFRLMSLQETGFLSKDGPFEVITGLKGDLILNSPDQSLFSSRLAKGAGAPVGKARWRVEKGSSSQKEGRTFNAEFHVTSNMRTPNWGAPGGHVQMDTRVVEVFFAVDQEVEFKDSSSIEPVFEPHLELMFGVKAMQVSVGKVVDGKHVDIGPVEAGMVSDVMVDIYYC